MRFPSHATSGQKLVGTYFLFAYLGPMAANFLFSDRITSSYHLYSATPSAVLSIFACFLLFLLGSSSPWAIGRLVRSPVWLRTLFFNLGAIYVRTRLAFSLGLVVLGCYCRSTGLNSYRYGEQGLSELNRPEVLLLIVATILSLVDLACVLFSSSRSSVPTFSRRHVEDMLLAGALILLANGTVTLFLGLFAFFGCATPRAFRAIFFLPARLFSWDSLRRLALSFGALGVIFLAAWVGGETIKSHSSLLRPAEPKPATPPAIQESPPAVTPAAPTYLATLQTRVTHNDSFLRKYPYYVAESLSVYYYSYLFTENVSYATLQNSQPTVLVYPLHTLAFRFDYLTGRHLGINRPEIGSLMRLNYTLLTADPVRKREGSSPGLLGSFNYVFPRPAGMLFAAIYLCLVSWAINQLFAERDGRRLSPVGYLLLLAFLHGLFQSPFDVLMIIDDGTIFFLTFFGAAGCQALAEKQPDALRPAAQS